MEVRVEAVVSGAVLALGEVPASAAVLASASAEVRVVALEAVVAEAEPPVAQVRGVEAAEKVVCRGSGSLRPRYCAEDPSREAVWPAQAAEKAAFPCRKKMSAPCSVCSRNWASRARIPKRAWKYPHFNRA